MSTLELTVLWVIGPVLSFGFVYRNLTSWNTSSRVVMSASLTASGIFLLLALLGENPVIWVVLGAAAFGVFLLESLLTPLLKTGQTLFEEISKAWRRK